MSEFFTQVADFLGQRWAELLALVGGTAGVVTICTILSRFLIALIVAKVQKKNNVPVNDTLNQLQAEIKELRGVVDKIITEAPKLLSDATKQALKQQRQAKRKAYAKIVEGKDIIEEKIEEEQQEVEKVQEVIEEKIKEVKKEPENVTKVVIKSE